MTASPATPNRSEPFSVAVVATLLFVGIAAFCAFVTLGAYAPDLRGDAHGGESALSRSAIGFAGLAELLRALDIPVGISRIAASASRPAFLVATPPPGTDPSAVAAELRGAAVSLIVLPKWQVRENDDHPGWVDRQGLLEADRVAAVLPVAAALSRRDGTASAVLHGGTGVMDAVEALRLGPIDRLQTIAVSDEWTPILMDEDGHAVLARWAYRPGRSTYVLSDPDLLNTQGLKDGAAARAALTILDGLRDGAPVTFDVTLNGLGRPRSLLRLLFEPPLLAATLCGAASGLLILLMAMHRFGPAARAERVLDFGKRALADNSAGLIALARREPAMAIPYADLTRAFVIREIGAPARLDRRRMDQLLDSVGASRGLPDCFTDLARAAAEARTTAALVAVAARLHRWSQGIRRGYR